MTSKRGAKIAGWIIAAGWLAFGMLPPVRALLTLPQELTLYAGESVDLNLGWLSQSRASGDPCAEVTLQSAQRLMEGNILTIDSTSSGESRLDLSLLGIPLRTVKLSVRSDYRLLSGGECIGVALHMRGVLVVGLAEMRDDNGQWVCPAALAGLQPGDEIEAFNGVEVESAVAFLKMLAENGGNKANLVVRRGRKRMEMVVEPMMDATTNQPRLGMWVRDSTAGVGTLTYIDPVNRTYGALGHSINDPDTGKVLRVKDGWVVQAHVLDIVRGQSGVPGELQGEFSSAPQPLGDIQENCDFGIFGNYEGQLDEAGKSIPIGTQASVETGKASILTTLDDGGVKEYECVIQRVTRQGVAQTKSMVVQITDPELLERTGGIVQGMSGSPILQNGRIIGAVTHVFINDPTRGYGVFIEWMLEQSQNLQQNAS
nr:SpoIVB peptidase [bacterium]